jgi:hypothetical protein
MQVSRDDSRDGGTPQTDPSRLENMNADNSHPATTLGYKVFEQDWTCRGFQFPFEKLSGSAPETSVTAVHEGRVKMCHSGFHFCQRALDCLSYYCFDSTNRFAQVEASGIVITIGDKSVTDHLTLVRQLSYDEFKDLCTGIVTTRLPHGGRQFTPYLKGDIHGTKTRWNEQGQVSSTITYEHGLEQGEFKSWYDNGQICGISPYFNGFLHGTLATWHSNGQKSREETYVHGRLHGIHTLWHRNGQIACIKPYKNNILDGYVQRWDELGRECTD